MKVDRRIIPVEKIDQSRMVLVDAHSLASLANALTDPSPPKFDLAVLIGSGGPTLANIIQTVVLHDTVLVDSLLFQAEQDVETACELFPDAIRGVYLRDGIRRRIGQTVDRICGRWDSVGEPPQGITSTEWAYWQQQDSSEKPLMDTMTELVPELIPPEYENDEEIRLTCDRSLRADLPLCCLLSTMTVGRAHFYLELARELDLPLSADPIRSRYFQVLLERFHSSIDKGTPEKVIEFYDKRTTKARIEESEGLISENLTIPAVAEYAVLFAQSRRCSLHAAVSEIRRSANAVKFREWCARLRSLTGKGRGAVMEQAEMLDELKNACEVWRKDIREEVQYKTRKLNLEKLPLIGGVLKALNLHEAIKINDPILQPSKRFTYFLFLNDLLRLPGQQ